MDRSTLISDRRNCATVAIFAGVSAVTAWEFISYGDVQLFVGFIGGGVTVVGFADWFRRLLLSESE